MLSIFMTIVAAIFLFFKPPLPDIEPHLTAPPRHNQTRSTQVIVPAPPVSTNVTITVAEVTSNSVQLATAPTPQVSTSPTVPSDSTPTTAAQPLVANPTLAVALENQPARQILYERVAARSLGEGSFAVPEIACTVKNRLQVSGASINVVLRAYHARDVRPQPQHIELVRQVFEDELPCPATWWYALSLQDTRHWKPHPQPAIVIRRNPRSQIWIFHR